MSKPALQQRTGNSLAYRIGSGIIGDQLLKSWNGADRLEFGQRRATSSLSRALLLFCNDVDDHVDVTSMTTEDKIGFLVQGREHLLDGRCKCTATCSGIFTRGLKMHDALIDGENSSFGRTFDELFEAGVLQLESGKPNDQLTAALSIGKTCMLLSLNAGEFVTKRLAPTEVHDATGNLGAYSYLLDIAYEIEEDIANGEHNLATVLSEQGMDYDAIRRFVMNISADQHEKITSSPDLTKKQIRLFTRIGRLVKLKYQLQGSASWLI